MKSIFFSVSNFIFFQSFKGAFLFKHFFLPGTSSCSSIDCFKRDISLSLVSVNTRLWQLLSRYSFNIKNNNDWIFSFHVLYRLVPKVIWLDFFLKKVRQSQVMTLTFFNFQKKSKSWLWLDFLTFGTSLVLYNFKLGFFLSLYAGYSPSLRYTLQNTDSIRKPQTTKAISYLSHYKRSFFHTLEKKYVAKNKNV